MKFQVAMKDPDTLHDAIADAVSEDVASILDEDERAALSEVRAEKARRVAAKWFRYSEYLTVEIDTDAETISVVPTR